jgi:iron transport multicopper oxidase
MPGLIKSFLSVSNPTGAEPVPNSALMNDTQNHTIAVEPGKTYFLRIVNMAAFAAQYFWIEDHTMIIIEVDGVYHKPTEASQLYITAAQRYGVLLTTKNTTSTNSAIVGSMDQDLFDVVPETLNPNVTSYLVYNPDAALPTAKFIDSFDPFDDMGLVPTDEDLLYIDPAISVKLDVQMDNLGDGANYAFFNDITYVRPKVPTIYTVMTSGNMASNPVIYGSSTNTFVLKHNDVVEIVLNNHDPGKHPFHLHGHVFQAIARGEEDSGDWDPRAVTNGSLTLPRFPMRRDVLLVRPNGHIVLRFRADNPGVWLFHCHIEWHVDSGLIMTFIEAPEVLQRQMNTPGAVPADHFEACRALDPPMAIEGNAAGNTVNLLDLEGENLPPKPLPSGFTARGIVALVFSCIAGILGVIVIAWYGLGEMGEISRQKEEAKITRLSAGGGVDGDGSRAEGVVRSVRAK